MACDQWLVTSKAGGEQRVKRDDTWKKGRAEDWKTRRREDGREAVGVGKMANCLNCDSLDFRITLIPTYGLLP